MNSKNSDDLSEGHNSEIVPDLVEEASRESFPASDPPGWISQHAEDLAMDTLAADPVERLKQLAQDAGQHSRYEKILDYRDQLLTQAVTAAAKTVLKASGYTDSQTDKQAIALVGDYLSQSSVPEIDQQMLALVGTESLFGVKLQSEEEDDTLQLYTTDTHELDLLIVLRLAKALNQSLDQETLLWRMIANAMTLPPEEAELVRAAISALLDEIPISQLDDEMGNVVVNSVLGG